MNENSFIRLNEYALTDSDEATYPHYYGFANQTGDWYIVKESNDGSMRYTRSYSSPTGLYSDAWNNRTVKNYMYWETSF